MDRRGDDGRRAKRDGTVALEVEGGSHQSRNAGGRKRLEKAGEILPLEPPEKNAAMSTPLLLVRLNPCSTSDLQNHKDNRHTFQATMFLVICYEADKINTLIKKQR